MYYEKKYQIWHGASTDSSRPVLNHVLVSRVVRAGSTVHSPIFPEAIISALPYNAMNGVMVATNGYILVAVPCQLQEEDVPGLVRANIFKYAKSVAGRRTMITMELGGKYVTLDDGSMHVRNVDRLSFPKIYNIWPRVTKESEWPTINRIAIGMKHLSTISKALGINNRSGSPSSGIKIYPHPSLKPKHKYHIGYLAKAVQEDRRTRPPEIPFGVIMAVRTGSF